MLPSVSAKALSRPSSFICSSQPTRSSAAGVANVASVAGASRPLPLLTMSSPIPLSQVSKNQRSALKDSGFSETPASLSARACVRSSSSVSGGSSGSRPASTQWALL